MAFKFWLFCCQLMPSPFVPVLIFTCTPALHILYCTFCTCQLPSLLIQPSDRRPSKAGSMYVCFGASLLHAVCYNGPAALLRPPWISPWIQHAHYLRSPSCHGGPAACTEYKLYQKCCNPVFPSEGDASAAGALEKQPLQRGLARKRCGSFRARLSGRPPRGRRWAGGGRPARSPLVQGVAAERLQAGQCNSSSLGTSPTLLRQQAPQAAACVDWDGA